MKKLYSKSNSLKAVSLGTAMAALLSSVSPVFAAGVAITGGLVQYDSGPGVPYTYGSHGSIVFAGDNDFCGADNVKGRGGSSKTGTQITAEDQYRRFIENQEFSNRNPYGTTTEKVIWSSDGTTTPKGGYMGTHTGGMTNAMPEAYGVYSFVTGCGAAATGNYSTAFGAGATTKAGGAQAFGVSALASGKASIAMGVGSEASEEATVAIGGLATASGKNTVALGVEAKAQKEYAIAIGARAEAQASGAIAIGGVKSERTEQADPKRKAIAQSENAIAIGSHTYAKTEDSVAIGANAQVLVNDGVAIGGGSVSDRDKGVKGYDPYLNGDTTETGIAWVSTAGAFSVGEVDALDGGGNLTRQITGVAAGTKDTDAVNVAQLKALRGIIGEGGGSWQISANDTSPTDVNAGNTVDFSVKSNNVVGKDNLKIEKSNEGDKHKIQFTLNDNLQLTSITTGRSTMSDDGFGFTDNNGPRIAFDGIHAGDKVITGVKAGEEDTDAVNYKQLKEVRDASITHWQLTVNGESPISIGQNDTVNLKSANKEGKKNITIVGDDSRNVTFDLANNITVTSVTAGRSKMSDDGFIFDGDKGPRITVDGISAGKKKITDVEAGTVDTDAVNFKQLTEVKGLISKAGGWKLSVNNDDATDIEAGNTVKFTAVANNEGHKNIKIVRGDNNEVKFDLNEVIQIAKTIKVGSEVTINNSGLAIKQGPSITYGGIDAGNKELKNVANGVLYTDAVNLSQLQEVEEKIKDVTSNSLVKWEEGQKLISVGKEKDGTKIDITGTSGERTIAGVKKGDLSKNSTEAVNGSQLWDTEQKVAHIDKRVDIISSTVTDMSKEVHDLSEDAVRYDRDENGQKTNKVTLRGGDKDAPVLITNVSDGNIKSGSKDAVNGGQINTISEDIARFFGGGTEFNNGTFSNPRYNLSKVSTDGKIEQKEYNDVGNALEGLDTNIKNVNTHVQYVDNKFDQKFDKFSQDALLWSENEQAFVALHGEGRKTNSKIKFLKDGDIDVNSTDAINGSQLFEIAKNISNYFGGSTDVIDGIEPAFLIKDETYNNVTDAFTGVNISIKNLDDKIIEMKENNLVQQEGISGVITIGAKTAGTKINVAGVGGAGRTISGVKAAEEDDEAVNKAQLDKSIKGISKDALLWDEEEGAFVALHEKDGKKTKSKLKSLLDGEIIEGSTDAITGNQLYLMSNKLANYFGGGAGYKNGQWTDPTFKISKVDENGKTVETKHNNVADAFDDISNGMSNINNRIDNVINKVDSDALKWNENKKAYDAGRNGQPSKIINVADGKIAKDSKEAVNGGQLWKTNERVANVENHVEIIDKKVDNISNTITNIGDTVNNINVKVDKIDDKVNNIAEDAVRYDRDANGKKTNKITLKGGNESEPVMIDNVADGRIEKGSKEAVNGGQLHDYTKEQMKIVLDESKHYTDQRVNNIVIDAIDDAVERSKQYTDMKFDALNYSIEGVRKEARQAAAIGLAVANLRYNDTPGKLSVGFGTGLWRSQSAFAFGAGYTSEKGNIRSNVSVTTSGGHWGVGAGFNMTLN
ncbi:Vomp family autotransporter [Bartonella senegalensis]|uniref:Vomp family autotransporter n=1 Tax=Bartonella senegalensis TaxID=1468418 RepID=UPI00031A16DA|nr:Vomp family autotransporter [Bartonella senegalensis]